MKHTSGLLTLALAAALLPAAAGADDSTASRGTRGAHDRYDDDRYDKDGDRYKDDDRSKDDDRYRDGRYEGGRYNDGRRGGYVDSRVVRDLAHDLEGLTRSAYREALRGDDRHRYRDRYGRGGEAIADLDRLHDRARQFRRDVDRSNRDRRSSHREFDALYRAYDDASDSLRTLRPDRDLRELFRRVDHTMGELVDYYGGSSRYAGWNRRSRDWDRDWDRDRDRDRDRDDWDRDRQRSSDSRYGDGRYDDDDRDDDDDDDDDDDRDHEAHRRGTDDDR
jgi:hypothetical protein